MTADTTTTNEATDSEVDLTFRLILQHLEHLKVEPQQMEAERQRFALGAEDFMLLVDFRVSLSSRGLPLTHLVFMHPSSGRTFEWQDYEGECRDLFELRRHFCQLLFDMPPVGVIQ